MARNRLSQSGASNRTARVQPGATAGATIGVDVFNQDGTLFDPSQAAPQPNAPAGDLTTDDVAEGGNLYFTDARAQASARTVAGRTVVAFAFGDASPRTIYIAPNARTAVLARVVIDTPFNGAGAAIAVGTAASPEQFMPYAGNDPATSASYESAPEATLNTGDAVQLSITPGAGATQGAGRVILDAYES